MKDYCAPASNGQCSCRKFGADPNDCAQGVDLAAELARMRDERDHWRANHVDQVVRCALLRQRPDLPVDRIPAYAELVRLQHAHTARIERDHALRWKLMQADGGACTCMTKTPEPAYHAETCRHRLIMEALALLDPDHRPKG